MLEGYAYSLWEDDGTWSGLFETREAALKQGRREIETEHNEGKIFTAKGQCYTRKDFNLTGLAEEALRRCEDYLYEELEVGEEGDDWPHTHTHVKDEDLLDKAIADVVFKFLEGCKALPTPFFRILPKTLETHLVKEKEDDADS